VDRFGASIRSPVAECSAILRLRLKRSPAAAANSVECVVVRAVFVEVFVALGMYLISVNYRSANCAHGSTHRPANDGANNSPSNSTCGS
jgi:hypothetical protein